MRNPQRELRQPTQPSELCTFPSVERSVAEPDNQVQVVHVTQFNRLTNCSVYQTENQPGLNCDNPKKDQKCLSHMFTRSMLGDNPYGGSIIPSADGAKTWKNTNAKQQNTQGVSMLS